MQRENFRSGAKWEEIVGYSRVVKMGKQIWVSGTVAIDDEGNTIGIGDPGEQTRFILQKIKNYLTQASASLMDVVRTRIFVTDISQWEAVGKAHGAFFRDIKPATTMVEVKALINVEYMVEIEVEAFIGEP